MSTEDWHPMPKPGDGEPQVFVQWKGTDVCADFHCRCGSHQHICNEMFMYRIRCLKCGQSYQVQSVLFLHPCESGEHDRTGELCEDL